MLTELLLLQHPSGFLKIRISTESSLPLNNGFWYTVLGFKISRSKVLGVLLLFKNIKRNESECFFNPAVLITVNVLMK